MILYYNNIRDQQTENTVDIITKMHDNYGKYIVIQNE